MFPRSGACTVVLGLMALLSSVQPSRAQTCAPGTFSATGSAPCIPCIAGTYAPTSGLTTCTPCPAGRYCPAGSSAPIPCPAGTYNGATGAPALSFCTPCPAGTYNPAGASTSSGACIACPPGRYCPAQSSAPIACPAWTFNPHASATSLSACTPCPAGTYSGAASIACNACVPSGLPMISQHPGPIVARNRQQIILIAAAVSPPPLATPTIYWRRNGVTVTDGGPFLGSQTGTLHINPVSAGVAGSYDAVAINSCGFVATVPAAVTIICPADFDGNQSVTVADIFGFLSAWFAMDIAADFNASGQVTPSDLFAYLTAWFARC